VLRKSRLCSALLYVMALAVCDTAREAEDAPSMASSEDAVTLAGGETCRACSLAVDTIGPTIGGPDDPTGVFWGDAVRMSVEGDGKLWLAPATTDGLVVRYDGPGAPEVFGVRGDGPGEFKRISGISAEGDSVLWVWGDREIRFVRRDGMVFSSEKRNRLPMSVHAMVPIGPLRFAMIGWFGPPVCANCPGAENHPPLHPLRIATFNEDGELLSHRPVEDIRVAPADPHAGDRGAVPVAASRFREGAFWTSAVDRLALQLRDSVGAVRRVLRVDAAWFPAWEEGSALRPPARVAWIREDDRGRVWMVVDGSIGALWEVSDPPKNSRPRDLSAEAMTDDRVSAVVVVDPDGEVVVLERVLPMRLVGPTGGALAVVGELPAGHQTVTPVRLSIRPAGG